MSPKIIEKNILDKGWLNRNIFEFMAFINIIVWYKWNCCLKNDILLSLFTFHAKELPLPCPCKFFPIGIVLIFQFDTVNILQVKVTELRSDHETVCLHCAPNVRTKYEFGPDKDFRGQSHCYEVKLRLNHDTCTLTLHHQCFYQVWTASTLRFPRYGPDKIFKVTALRPNLGHTMTLHT